MRTATAIRPGGDGGLLRLRDSRQGIAASTDGKGRYCYIDPRLGALHTVFESARNVAAVGARPVAITNCLNFGNPYKPEIYWQFKEAVAGIGEACRAFDTPVTGGNVSFYNESPTGPVYPTPVIGMLGIIEDSRNVVTSGFKAEGDVIILLGRNLGHVGASEYLSLIHDLVAGDTPELDLSYEKRLQQGDRIGFGVKHAALKEASGFGAESGKTLSVVKAKQKGMVLFKSSAQAEVEFRCN